VPLSEPTLLQIVRAFMTFQGYQEAGNWHGTPVADVLPVDTGPIDDDRVERPEGAGVALTGSRPSRRGARRRVSRCLRLHCPKGHTVGCTDLPVFADRFDEIRN
jgi:hypothetical protein